MAKETYKYTTTHEWIEFDGQGKARVGITDHAQEQLGDIVFVNLPEVGDRVTHGEAIMDVESVKAASDIYSPLDGVIVSVNQELEDAPEKINEAAYDTYIFELDEVGSFDDLMDYDGYTAFLESEDSE